MTTATPLSIPKSVFRRLCKDEIDAVIVDRDFLVTREALATLQGATEEHLVDMFGAATRHSATQKRVTLRVADIEAARAAAAAPLPNTIASYDNEMDARLVGMEDDDEDAETDETDDEDTETDETAETFAETDAEMDSD